MYCWDSKLQVITAACKTFVDDSRSVAATQKLARDATYRVEIVMGYLVLQDTTINCRLNSQTPEEWTGYITFFLENIGLFVTVSERKRGKAKEIICDLLENFNESDHLPEMYLKGMERKTGFGVKLAMAHPFIVPFMRGLYLTIKSWRPKRDREGCKLSKRDYDSFINTGTRQGNLG